MTCVVIATALGALCPLAGAATIPVTATADAIATDGKCSLREAISSANADLAPSLAPGECSSGSGADTITLPAGTYLLSIAGADEDANATGDLDVLSDLTIAGAGAGDTTVDGGHHDGVFDVAATAHVELADLMVTGGRTPDGADGGDAADALDQTDSVGEAGEDGEAGGGIFSAGTLTVRRCVVAGNATGDGGDGGGGGHGGDSVDPLAAPGSSLGGPGGDGGDGAGIFSSGSLAVIDTVIKQNAAGDGGQGGTAGKGGSGGAFDNSGSIAGGAGGGQGGTGGSGSGVASTGELVVRASSIRDNEAGDGGAGGVAGTGGDGLAVPGGRGGQGGPAWGGTGGRGGPGGGIWAVALTLSGSSIVSNTAGSGGAGGGGGQGGAGAPGAQPGAGGGVEGGNGGDGANGGGILSADAAISSSTISGNAAGDGGNGSPAGTIGSHPPGGADNWSSAGYGGSGGGGGGAFIDGTLDNSTLAKNRAGNGGNGADAAAGTKVYSGGGGYGSVGGGFYAPHDLDVAFATVVANVAGVAGTTGSGTPRYMPGSNGRSGAFAFGQDGSVRASIMAHNLPDNCYSSTGGNIGRDNLSWPDGCGSAEKLDPLVGDLTDGVTHTQVMVPALDSFAINRVIDGCPATDQQGASRLAVGCTAGAVEVPVAVPEARPPSSLDATSVTLQGYIASVPSGTSYNFEIQSPGNTGRRSLFGGLLLATQDPGAVVTSAPLSVEPNSTYEYRLVTLYRGGKREGNWQSFTTGERKPAVTGPTPPITSPRIAVSKPVLRRHRGFDLKTGISVTCPPGTSSCEVVLEAPKLGRRPRRHLRFQLGADRSRKLAFKLNAAEVRSLLAHQRLAIPVTVTARRAGAATARRSTTLVVRIAKRKSR